MHRSCAETTEEAANEEGCGLAESFSNQSGRIAYPYALVAVQHRKSSSEIQDSPQVLLSHTKEKHDNCPPVYSSGAISRREWLIILLMADLSSSTREPYINPSEFARAVEVFKVFGSLSFCSTISLGKTQNSNESLHNMLWPNSPNSKHLGQNSLLSSTGSAVLSFNDGSLSHSRVMEELGLTISNHTLMYLSKRERIRNLERARRVKDSQTPATTNDCTEPGRRVLEARKGQEGLCFFKVRLRNNRIFR